MLDDNLISIVTPAWKAESFIANTIASVRAQTYTNWEMIIVDDCSPDDTSKAVSEIAQNDERIKLVRHSVNGGPSAARNTGVSHANGRWIAMLDSDDSWLPNKLEKQINFQKNLGCKLTYTSYRRIFPQENKVGDFVRVPETITYAQLLGNTAIATSTVMIDRKLAGDIHFKKIYYDDFGCWLDSLRDGSVAYGLQEDLMRYSVLQNSVSRNKLRSAKEVWKTYRSVENLSLLKSTYFFSCYALNAIIKYRKF
jgi:teichuronic acid biosynthesis glycosyltransferase TuaG